MTNAQKIQLYMRNLGITETEAKQLIEDDKTVDRMTSDKQVTADLTKEQKQIAKEMRSTQTRKVTAYNFNKRERKKDDEKENFIADLAELLENLSTEINIVNPSREISFKLGNNSYSLTLVKHRK